MAGKTVSPRALLAAVVTALVAGLLLSLAVRPAGSTSRTMDEGSAGAFETVRWRVTSSFSSNLPVIGPPPHRLAEELAELTDGAFQMKVYNPGEVVPTLEITESVKEAKVQAGFQSVLYDQGRIPAAPLISAVPFGMEFSEFFAWWYHGGGRELGEELYQPHNVMPVLCGGIGPETAGWFLRPIDSLDDLAGLKIRFSGLGGKVLQRLGASVTLIPAGEIFQALEKGAIDGTEFSMPVIDQLLGFSRVATYNYFPGWHQPFSSAHLLVNLDAWNALRPDTQALVRMACRATALSMIAEGEALQGEVVRDYEQNGVQTRSLPEEILLELRRVTNEVLDEEAARDENFARILESQRAFSETYRYWKTRAYLPRTF